MKVEYPVRADWNSERPKSWVSGEVWKYADFCENLDFGLMVSGGEEQRKKTFLVYISVCLAATDGPRC